MFALIKTSLNPSIVHNDIELISSIVLVIACTKGVYDLAIGAAGMVKIPVAEKIGACYIKNFPFPYSESG